MATHQVDYIIKQIRYNVWQLLEVNSKAEREVGIIVQEENEFSSRPMYNPEWSHGHPSLEAARDHIIERMKTV